MNIFVNTKRAYYVGILVWRAWLPAAAVFIYLMILGLNITSAAFISKNAVNLLLPLRISEVFALFFVGPLLFTKLGPVISLSACFYLINRFGWNGSIHPATLAMLTSLLIITLLGDKWPWINDRKQHQILAKLREILLTFSSLIALGITTICVFKINTFSDWINSKLDWSLSSQSYLMLLSLMILTWLTVALRLTRSISLSLLCIPTLFVFSFITSTTGLALTIPFAICLCLAIASIDRRSVRTTQDTFPTK